MGSLKQAVVVEKSERYRQVIQKVLADYQAWASGAEKVGVKESLCFDDERGHYQWFSLGWEGKRRVFNISLYLRLENEKIWIEEDWTKRGVADDLLEAGVPAEDIVLGFQHPSKRPLTEFSVA